MKKRIIFSLLSLGLISIHAHAQEQILLSPPQNSYFKDFETHTPELNLKHELKSEAFKKYLQFYQLDFPQTRHYAGLLRNSETTNFVHVLEPPNASRGTLVALHGYFVHSGLMYFLIAAALKQNFRVIVMDLPGHGLSAGRKVSIQDFSHYASAIKTLTDKVVIHFPGPYFLLGHSTGGAGAWEYCLKYRTHPYHRLVLAAPLVRSRLWDLSMFGIEFGQHFVDEVPRILTPTSSDSSFHSMIKRDPLQYPGTPIEWVKSLKLWNEHVIENYAPGLTPTLIIQGLDDTVVEWEYNIPFLSRKFPVHELKLFPGAKHDLYWESPAIRKQVIEKSLDFTKLN